MWRKVNRVRILDCTIRDGGYISNWHFSLDYAKRVYDQCCLAGIDCVEMGYKTSAPHYNPEKHGIWKNVSESMLKQYNGSAKISVMVDDNRIDIKEIVKAEESTITLYRVAVHPYNIPEALSVIRGIREKGYRVSMNLMYISEYTEQQATEAIEQIKDEDIEYLYLVDTKGELHPHITAYIVKKFKGAGKKLGYHGHNENGMVLENTLAAIKSGVEIVDCTDFGMGRNGGNLCRKEILSAVRSM